MAGHSKWAQIKHKKKATDAKRGQMFSKLARAIIVAAKEGGADPAGNLALQNAIEKAKAFSMPKENIERAVARGAGTDGGAEAYEAVVYEGYGPTGVAVIVETLTDNRNRTASEIRHAFTKHDGNLGSSGSVAWLFERKGILFVGADRADEETVIDAALEGGAEDVSRERDVFEVLSAPEKMSDVRTALEAAGLRVESAEVTLLPKTTVSVDEEGAARKIVRMMDALEEIDDVQGVYANFDIPEQVLEAVET